MHASTDSGQSRVRKTIKAASRRSSLVLLVENSAFTLAAVFGGIILLLLLGTQILNWPWLVVLGALGAVVTLTRARGRILSRYRVAQIVDRRLALNDSLSTAWFLLEDSTSHEVPFAQEQIQRAEEIAPSVQPAKVFPFVWRRTWVLAGAFGAVAFGLFALRYLVLSRLDFKQALIANPLSFPAEVLEYLRKPSPVPGPGRTTLNATNTIPERAFDSKQSEQNVDDRASGEAPGKAGESSNKLSADDGKLPDRTTQTAGSTERKTDSQPGLGGDKNGQPGGKSPDAHPSPNPQSPNEARQEGNRQPSGLMDRMKEALSGLMAKMSPQTANQNDSQHGKQESKPGQQNSQNGSRNPQPGQNPQNSQQSEAQGQQQNAQGQQAAQASEKAPISQSHSSDESASSKGADAQSGIGRQDGEKTLKEAEQLRAMGKLDEIIGKRSSSLTGDMTVETHSSHEQLRTQYSGRIGHHADLGGEINRDEVPVALQQYVRDYMEEVRKQANDQP